MKKLLPLLLLAFFVIGSAFTINVVQSWNISSDYNIKFSGTSANGTFSGLTGKIIFDANNLSSAMMNVEVDVNSISTGNNTKNKHAKGESWFYAEKYPKITFTSTSFAKSDSGYQVEGALTLRGVTKNISIPFTFSESNLGGVFEGKFSISRDAYGIEGPFFGFTVGDEFLIELKVPVVR